MSQLTEAQRTTLRVVCDTVVPTIPAVDDPDGFWSRAATDVGADQMLEQALVAMPPEQAGGLAQLLDALEQQGFSGMSQLSREQVFTNLSLASMDAAVGVSVLIGLTLMFTYAGVDPASGRNPFWTTLGYPGPISAPPQEPKTIPVLDPA